MLFFLVPNTGARKSLPNVTEDTLVSQTVQNTTVARITIDGTENGTDVTANGSCAAAADPLGASDCGLANPVCC